MVIIKDKNPLEIKEIIATGKAVIVDVFTTWCPPCKELAKVLEKVSKKYKSISIVKINLDVTTEKSEILEKWHEALEFYKDVTSLGYVPIMLFFKNGTRVDKYLDDEGKKNKMKGLYSGYAPFETVEQILVDLSMN
jgi:thiol-disulfide isomerase/thioredoxin